MRSFRLLDKDGLRVDELTDAQGCKLAAIARHLDAAEGKPRIGGDHAVDEDHTGIKLVGEAFAFVRVFGPCACSEAKAGVVCDMDRFVDIRALSHRAAAERINADAIDILIDLKGYTQHARPRIAAYRPAPVQVSWLGYPATMGAPFIDGRSA